MTKYLFFSLLLSFSLVAFSQGNKSKTELNELHIRGGLPNFYSKATHGGSIKVAYLGGSITAQEGWRVLSLGWFKQRFPKAQFSEINAAIGGTGSDFGAFRLRDHVLKFNPDLIFVEFAVNDSGTNSEKIICSMEGIVRQIWEHNPKTDICFVYTIMEGFIVTEQKGDLPNSAKTMENVANRYGIPTINFGFEVAHLDKTNELVITGKEKEQNGVKVFSPDGVHPYPETGHQIYLSVLKRSFETMISDNTPKPKKHKLAKPLAPDYFANTQMVDFSEFDLSPNWETMQIADNPAFSGFGRFLTKFGKAGQTGETLTIRFKGRTIGAYDIMGPDAGKVIVEVDGMVKDTISRFDAYCTYRRLNYFLIDKLENKEHIVVFRVLAEPFDKAAILAKRNEKMENPDDYRGNNWYVGKILVDGKLLK
jgi:hypothetical protein